MNFVDRLVGCDICKTTFYMDDSCVKTISDGEISVQYLQCPHCGARFQILTTDAKMRELIQERERLQTKIAAAHKKKFREKTIKQYMKELDRIRTEQEKCLPELKKRGELLLQRGVLES